MREQISLLAIACCAACATQEDNETGPRLNTLEIAGGVQLISAFDSDVRLDFKPLGVGTDIDFEDDLGFEAESQVARIDAVYRFNRRHGIRFSWFDIERTTGASTDMDIVWGDITIPAGSGVSAFLDTSVTKLNYRYTPWFGEDWEAGFSIGVHGMRLGTGISLNNLATSQEYKGTVPLPVLGVFGAWEFHDDWRVTGFSEALYAKLSASDASDEFEGYVVDTYVGVEWDVFDNFGLGVGGNWFILDLEAEDDLFRLSLDYSYIGALIFGRIYF